MKRFDVSIEDIREVIVERHSVDKDSFVITYKNSYKTIPVDKHLIEKMPTNKKDAIALRNKMIADKIRFYTEEIQKLCNKLHENATLIEEN